MRDFWTEFYATKDTEGEEKGVQSTKLFKLYGDQSTPTKLRQYSELRKRNKRLVSSRGKFKPK